MAEDGLSGRRRSRVRTPVARHSAWPEQAEPRLHAAGARPGGDHKAVQDVARLGIPHWRTRPPRATLRWTSSWRRATQRVRSGAGTYTRHRCCSPALKNVAKIAYSLTWPTRG